MIYELSFRGPGGSVGPGILTTFNQHSSSTTTGVPTYDNNQPALIGYERVIFIIHGFNVSEKEGRHSLSIIADKLQKGSEQKYAVVFVLWPGDSVIGVVSYSFSEGYQADDTALHLTRFIENHVGFVTSVDFIAHSLGCRVALETIDRLYSKANGKRSVYPVNQVCLLAAAVDDTSLSVPIKYRIAAERAERVVVLSSIEDKVLKFVYPGADLLQAFIFFWKESFGFALGYKGPKKSDSSGADEIAFNVDSIVIDEKFEVGHSDYLPPSDRLEKINTKQQSVIDLAGEIIAGKSELTFR